MCGDQSQFRNCSKFYAGQNVPFMSSNLIVGLREMSSETCRLSCKTKMLQACSNFVAVKMFLFL